MADVTKVFLSSVGAGFEDYREKVYQAIEGLTDHHCVRMEDFGARDAVSEDFCTQAIAGCDIFVGLFGPLYGSYVRGTEKSFTEMEFEVAQMLDKKRFLFITDDDFPIAANLIEPEKKVAKQKKLRERAMKDRQAARFLKSEQLGTKVLQAIYNEQVRSPDDREAETLVADENRKHTTLLFPYVTNLHGFDTGLFVVNASATPFGTQPQAGTMLIHHYGFSRSNGSAAAPAPIATPVVPPGQHAAWTLSSGGTVYTVGGAIAAAPGFQGYIVVVCHFPDAHGFAFISDLAAKRVAAGYTSKVLKTE